MPEGDGEQKAPRRTHLESLARQGDVEAGALLASAPPLPTLGAHVLAYWSQLTELRSVNGMALARISRAEIRAWERDEAVRLHRWERRTLLEIDRAYVTLMSGGDYGTEPRRRAGGDTEESA